MSQALSLSRAALLVGVTRGALQKKIKDGLLPSHDGMVEVDALLAVYPDAQLEDATEFRRVSQIKERAFGKRVFERALPDKEVLAARLTELGRELAAATAERDRYKAVVEALEKRLAEGGGDLTVWLREALAAPADGGSPLLARDTLLRVVAAQVRFLPSGREFFLEGADTLLQGALRAGIPLAYGCSSGSCGRCKARVVSGEVKAVRPFEYEFTPAEAARNMALMCSCTAVTDAVIEADVAACGADVPWQEIVTKVKSLERPEGDMLVLTLQMSPRSRLRYLSGQRARVTVGGALSADLFLASCPCDERDIQFHVRRLPGNHFADYVFNRLEEGEEVTVTGPAGEFVLRQDSVRPLVLVSWGAGFAPVKGLVEHALSLEMAESILLCRVGSERDDFYLENLCRAWGDALDNFAYLPLRETGHGPAESAARRLAELFRPLAEARPELGECDIFLAGPEEKTAPAREALLALGAVAERIRVS